MLQEKVNWYRTCKQVSLTRSELTLVMRTLPITCVRVVVVFVAESGVLELRGGLRLSHG